MVVRTGVEQRVHAQIAAGDIAGAAEQLVRLYGSAVLGRCRTLVRDHATAEDLAQEAFCRAFSGLAAFRGEASLRTWLFTIVRNVCIDHHRRTAGTAWLRDDDADAEAQAEERPFLIELMVDREQLERALAGLDERERALVVLRFVHGMEYAELANRFGLREGTIRMRLCRALARMREALGPRWEQEPVRGGMRGPAPRASVGARIFEKRVRPDRATMDHVPNGSSLEAPPLVASAEDRLSGHEALTPIAQALGELLERGEARPPVEGLLRALEPDWVGLPRRAGASLVPGESAPPKRRLDPKRWLGWLFGRPPRA
ncbi:MAG: sigma-70 family RNA polymerase sigma factor [Deltaproteobacteria bacterium]|nr:sigma-70 family RNA polymerase sigma factor [Deltaproteobacteria bacterium]